MLKRLFVVAIGLIASTSVASATITQDKNLLVLLNNGLEAACADVESQSCANFKNRIDVISNKISEEEAALEAAVPETAARSVVILVGEAKKIVSGDAVFVNLDTIGSNAQGELAEVVGVVEGVELFKSIGLVCPVANGYPAILNKVIGAAVSVEERLATLIIGELAKCNPGRVAIAAKTIVGIVGASAPGVLQQVQLLTPNVLDEVVGYIADADLPPEVQQAVANVLNETPTAAVPDGSPT